MILTIYMKRRKVKNRNDLDNQFDIFRNQHPDERSNAQWVKDMLDKGWDFDRRTSGQSEWQRINKR